MCLVSKIFIKIIIIIRVDIKELRKIKGPFEEAEQYLGFTLQTNLKIFF